MKKSIFLGVLANVIAAVLLYTVYFLFVLILPNNFIAQGFEHPILLTLIPLVLWSISLFLSIKILLKFFSLSKEETGLGLRFTWQIYIIFRLVQTILRFKIINVGSSVSGLEFWFFIQALHLLLEGVVSFFICYYFNKKLTVTPKKEISNT